MAKLNPCPYCKSAAQMVGVAHVLNNGKEVLGIDGYTVCCPKCGAEQVYTHRTEAKAAEWWNNKWDVKAPSEYYEYEQSKI